MDIPADKETRSKVVRLLVVDAQDDVVVNLPAAFRQRPLELYHVGGIEDTLRHISTIDIDIVLADIQAPDPSDVELLRRLHLESPRTKVVAISSGRDPSIVAGLLRQSAYSVLVRPLAASRIAEVLDQSLAAKDWENDLELLSGAPNWFQLRIACKFQAADRAAQIFREVPPNVDPGELDELATAFREILFNAIEHGGRSDPQMSIYVSFIATEVGLVFYVRDPGVGFSLHNLDHAAIFHPDGTLAHAEVREQRGIRPGGFGILLAKNLVDELIYSERGNEVILIKHRKVRPPRSADSCNNG